jgi:starch synthase
VLNVLYVTQEYAPYFADGGLGLTAAALPAELRRRGAHCTLVLPFYPRLIDEHNCRVTRMWELPPTAVGEVKAGAAVYQLIDPDRAGEVYLIRSDTWYDRAGIYRDEDYMEFPDAVARAAFFGRCVARWAQQSGRRFDLVHGNDWQSGAALAHLRARRSTQRTAYLMNIHSGQYRGNVPLERLDGLGLPAGVTDQLRDVSDGRPNLLLLGLLAADAAVVSSPAYAVELVETFATDPIGRELRRLGVSGIVSGVDEAIWNPALPATVPVPYDEASFVTGKSANKRLLQHQLHLRVRDDLPMFGVCSRLVEEKGIDILAETFAPLVATGRCQLVVVGPGEGRYGEVIRSLAADHPGFASHHSRFDQALAWRVYASADFTPMPSRVEPCGLNQLIAMAYGTVPVVTPVGGLRDTVRDIRGDPVSGTGFVAREVSTDAFAEAVLSAISWHVASGAEVAEVRRRCMLADWSWRRTADEFLSLYRDLLGRCRSPVSVE